MRKLCGGCMNCGSKMVVLKGVVNGIGWRWSGSCVDCCLVEC